jgi:hypothetical protein
MILATEEEERPLPLKRVHTDSQVRQPEQSWRSHKTTPLVKGKAHP